MKKIISLILTIVILNILSVPALAAHEAFAYPSSQALYLMNQDGSTAKVKKELPVYNINQNNYMKVRDIGYLMDFQVEYNSTWKAVSIITNQHSDGQQVSTMRAVMAMTAQPSSQSLYVNGQKVTGLMMYSIDGNNYLKLRDVAKAVGFGCIYSGELKAVVLSRYYQYTPNNIMTDGAARTITYVGGTEAVSDPTAPEEKPAAQTGEYPTAREDYLAKYADSRVQALFEDGTRSKDQFNAAVQSLIDKQAIYDSIEIPSYEITTENKYNPEFEYAYYTKDSSSKNPFTGCSSSVMNPYNVETLRDNTGKVISSTSCYTVMPGKLEQSLRTNYPELVQQVHAASSTRSKVEIMVRAVCDRLNYSKTNQVGDWTEIWGTKGGTLNGVCQVYEAAFGDLCYVFDIPYITLSGHNHIWNAVYLVEEGQWVIVDATGADNSFSHFVCVPVSSYSYMDGKSIFEKGEPAMICAEAVRIGYELRK